MFTSGTVAFGEFDRDFDFESHERGCSHPLTVGLLSQWIYSHPLDNGSTLTPLTVVYSHLGKHVEEKGVHVVVQRLMVKKQLGQQTQILTVQLVVAPVDFKHGYIPVSVDLRPNRLCTGVGLIRSPHWRCFERLP